MQQQIVSDSRSAFASLPLLGPVTILFHLVQRCSQELQPGLLLGRDCDSAARKSQSAQRVPGAPSDSENMLKLFIPLY